MIAAKFELKPVAKGRPRFGNGRAYTPMETKLFEGNLKALATRYMIVNRLGMLEGPIEVIVHFYLKKPRTSKNKLPCVKPDLDNFIKGVSDACNGVFWKDDAQICAMTVTKTYVPYGDEAYFTVLAKHLHG